MSLEQIDPTDFENALLDNRSTNPNRRTDNNVSVNISNATSAITDREERDREPITPDEERQFIKNVIFFTTNITALKEIEGFNKSDLTALIAEVSERGLESEVEEFYGLTFKSIKRLIETNALPTRLLNTILENHIAEVLEF